jgi:adenylate kinase
MNPPVACVIGSPSSGKRTQAWLLAQNLHIPQASMGRLLARLSAQPTDLGRSLQSAIKAGSTIDSRFFEAVLSDLLGEYASTGVLIDGYPRTRQQAEILLKLRERMGALVVIDLSVSDAEADRRLQVRLKEPGHVQKLSERPEIIQEKRLMYSLNQRGLARALAKAGEAGQCVYCKLDAAESPDKVQKALLAVLAEAVPSWRQGVGEPLALLPI